MTSSTTAKTTTRRNAAIAWSEKDVAGDGLNALCLRGTRGVKVWGQRIGVARNCCQLLMARPNKRPIYLPREDDQQSQRATVLPITNTQLPRRQRRRRAAHRNLSHYPHNRHPTFCSRRIVPDTPTPHARTRARHRLEAVLWPCTASNCACRLRTSSRQSTWHPSGIFSFLRTPPRRSSATRANASQPPRLPMHGTISHVQSLEVDRSPPPRATFAADASVV